MSEIVCTMPECQTTAGCFCRRAGIVSDYVAPFVPSVADAYYNGVIAQKDARIEQLQRELADTRSHAFEDAAQIADDYPLHSDDRLSPGSEANAFVSGQEFAASFITKALRAKAQPHSETRQEQR